MKRLAVPTGLLVLAVAVTGCGGDPLESGGGAAGSSDTVTVGSANFPENVLLGQLYATALEQEGIDVERKFNIGSREAVFPALESGDLDVIPEYSGSLLAFVAESGVEAKALPEQLTELEKALPEELSLLEASTAEDKDVIACNRRTADEHRLTTIGDLAAVAGDLTLGANPEFRERSIGVPGLKDVYGVEFGQFQPLDTAGPLTIEALKQDKVQCANLFSTQSAIVENDFVVLEDPKGLVEAENVVPLVRTDLGDEVTAVLNRVSASLDTETLKELVKQVEVDQVDPRKVAEAFLSGT